MKTIVFGGAFDPVHSEHISLAAAAVKELGAEKLVLVPTFSPGHKSNAEASFSDRVEMLKLAFSDFPVQTEISDVERISGKTNYTFEILPLIEKKYGEAFYLVGGDSLEHFSTWRHPEKILELRNSQNRACGECTVVGYGNVFVLDTLLGGDDDGAVTCA